MGKLLLCWATVTLWVRVALNVERHIGWEEVFGVVQFVWITDFSGKTQRLEFPSVPHYCLSQYLERLASLGDR